RGLEGRHHGGCRHRHRRDDRGLRTRPQAAGSRGRQEARARRPGRDRGRHRRAQRRHDRRRDRARPQRPGPRPGRAGGGRPETLVMLDQKRVVVDLPTRTVVNVLLLVIAAYISWRLVAAVGNVLILIGLATFLAVMLAPLVQIAERRMPRGLAVIAVWLG